MSRCAVGDRAALGVLHSRGSSAPGTHQFREIITSTSQRRPAAGGARSGNHGPQGRVVEAGAPLLGHRSGVHRSLETIRGLHRQKDVRPSGITTSGAHRRGDSAPAGLSARGTQRSGARPWLSTAPAAPLRGAGAVSGAGRRSGGWGAVSGAGPRRRRRAGPPSRAAPGLAAAGGGARGALWVPRSLRRSPCRAPR